MSGRILVLLVLIAIVILAMKRLKRSSPAPQVKEKATAGQMVQCATCGLYVPKQEAIQHQGKYYCSVAHRDEHKR